MPNVCILTDSTAQYTQSNFPGHERVYVIPFDTQKTTHQEGNSLPGGVIVQEQLIPPSPQEFIQSYTRLSRAYDSILVLTLASLLNPIMKHALSASEQYSNGATVEVIDSQTTAIGLGTLVQLAAAAASEGASLREIRQQLRTSIPRVYMLFCIPELIYLAYADLLDYAQALVAEMMGMLPIFSFEDGRLVPMEKVRTLRQMFEVFQDFMGEFETPAHFALVSSLISGSLRTRQLHQFVKDTFPGSLFSEHAIKPPLVKLLGPRSIGLFVIESVQ